MKLKIISLLLALIFISSSVTVFASDESNTTTTSYRVLPLINKLSAMTQEDIDKAVDKFTDMKKHWSRQYVGKLNGLEIISGNGDGTFKPDNPVQVDEFIKMAVRALGFKPGEGAKYWAQPYIDTALQQKLISTSEFKDYKHPITREEAARIMVKATLLNEAAPDTKMDNLVRSKILDYPKIKDENKRYVLQSYEIGLITGVNGKFLPSNTLTRAEASTIIIRNLDTASRIPFKPAEGDVFTITNPDGMEHTVYPPPKVEVLKAANAFKTAYLESKGYVWVGYSPSAHRIMYVFYESKDVYDKDSITTMQMSVQLDTINDEYYMEHPYYITLYDAAAVKRLHRDAIYEMFKYWFEKDADKAMAAFDRYLDYSTTNDQKNRVEEITNNGRLMFFYKVGGDNGFTLAINSLPK